MSGTRFDFVPSDRIRHIRAQVDHPILDADGHQNEYLPLFEDFLAQLAGPSMARRFAASRRDRGHGRVGPYWTLPTENTLDRASTTLPGLLYARLDEIGIDYALVYPGFGLSVLALPDDELRQASARAFNTMYHETFDGYRDRLEPVAVIPNFTPEEAVAELEHAVGTLGLKSVVMASFVARTRDRADGTKALWLDTLGHDSAYDYDPVWEKCQQLGVAPSFHSTGFGYGTRMSSSNYVYNHLGHFGWAQEAVCRSLVLGGAPSRFPALRFAFLEGGVTWGAQLQADLIGHFDKRNIEVIDQFDPAALDVTLFGELFDRFARGAMKRHRDALPGAVGGAYTEPVVDRATLDDFAEGGIKAADDIVRVFSEQFFFGCEADDPLNAVAFDRGLLPGGRPLNAVMASDIGHWDVPDMREVVAEAYELVERGHLDQSQFRDFTGGNLARMLTDVNPAFFTGTAVEGSIDRLLT
jgi:predicted TIM-barrel fold metal-dependent hydrolase